ncbi:exosortase B [Duganella sp. BuS-21]|uniref:exosortase B n=1 Tax=Duganella sp. BuS-21 TaxID=2943848 RepID=UPI0035A715AB
MALSIWLLQRQWPAMQQAAAGQPPATRSGWALVAFALLLYIIGRSQDILMFEMGSFIVLLAGLMLMIYGGAALKHQWFPFFFMLFMIPLPSFVVDTVTMPMKMAVSYVTEHLLFWAGYPIARTGVVLQIGQYQLMVADACAGLQTLLTLESLGLFYLNVVRHTSAFRNVALAILIVPISFTANVIRVITLTLITYYFGDAAGQGFMHGFAGMVLFISALVLILALDSFLQYIVRRRQSAASEVAP